MEVFSAIFGKNVKLESLIGKQYSNTILTSPEQNIEEPSKEEVENIWDLAAQAFGGPNPQEQ
jgi:hypothetical protein